MAGYVAYGGRFSADEATSTMTDDGVATTHSTLVWRRTAAGQ
jgi:hypothetical protein